MADLLVWYLVFLFSTTCHEFAHAYLAYRGGDMTAYEGGQVSLDPIPHIRRSPVGMVLAPLLSLYATSMMIGWGASPYDPRWASRHPTRYALMSLAGPMTNFALATVCFFLMVVLVKGGVFELSGAGSLSSLVTPPGEAPLSTPLGAASMMLSVGFSLNVILGVFNLLPLPPLDGAAVLEGFWPRSLGKYMLRLRETPMAGLIGLIVVWNLAPYIVVPVWRALVVLLYAIA